MEGRGLESTTCPAKSAVGVSCGAVAIGWLASRSVHGRIACGAWLISRRLTAAPSGRAGGEALGSELVGGGLDRGEDRLRRGAEEDGLSDGGLEVFASHGPVGGVVLHDGFEVADDGGGLLQDQRGIASDGLEVISAGEAVGGEVADHGFDVADDGRLVAAEEVRVGGGGLEVVPSHLGVGVELLADPCGVGRGLELFGASGSGFLQALHGVDAGGEAVEQGLVISVGHGPPYLGDCRFGIQR